VFEKAAMPKEVWAEEFGERKDDMAVRHGEQDMIDEVRGGALNFALMPGWAEQSAFAGERKQVL